jgi:hypothetical protein
MTPEKFSAHLLIAIPLCNYRSNLIYQVSMEEGRVNVPEIRAIRCVLEG